MIDAAKALAQRGFKIFPCQPRGKAPANPHSFYEATADEETICAWWGAVPDANIGLPTGQINNLLVVDVDDAEAALRKLEALHDELPATVEVITGRDGSGRHIYFRAPDRPLRTFEVVPHLEIRCTGAYVVAPPSVHPTGRRYCWSVDCGPELAEAPAWLLSLAQPDGSARSAPTPPAAWRELVAGGVCEGARDTTVTKLAGHLMRRYIDPFVALELLRSWNKTRCRPPLPDADIERIVSSIARIELKRRGADG